jgi:integral membrane protein
MPLKYLAGLPQMVRVTGMAHGILFVVFVFAVLDVAVRFRWPLKRVVGALVSSVVPFGPFVLDAHLRRDAQASAG